MYEYVCQYVCQCVCVPWRMNWVERKVEEELFRLRPGSFVFTENVSGATKSET